MEYNWRKNLIATASVDGTARLWDSSNNFAEKAILIGHTKPILKLTFSHEGNEIVTCSEDNTARIWKFDYAEHNNGQIKHNMEQNLQHDDQVFSCLYSPCGNKIITACKDNSCRIWKRTKCCSFEWNKLSIA